MNHTPGPWRIPTPSMGFSAIRGTNGALIFGLAAGSADEKQPDDVCEANARLIAAAPELYDALVAVSDMLFARPDIIAKLAPLMGPAEQAVCDVASAVLAKVRGDAVIRSVPVE